jgi:hypothetical protein
LPDPSDAVQYDLIEKKYRVPRVLNSFVAESAGISQRSTDGATNSSLEWRVGKTGMTTNDLSPDSTLASIFTTSLQVTNDSAATALSTIITILASMAYYDQFPNFAETARDVSTTYFQPFLFPQSFLGFTAVLAIAITHTLLVLLITAAFITSTRLTTLGDHWQTISQTISPATEDFLKKSSRATDKEVRKGLEVAH